MNTKKLGPRDHGAVPRLAGTCRRQGRPVHQGRPHHRVGRTRKATTKSTKIDVNGPKGLDPFASHGKMLEQGKADLYNACEWGKLLPRPGQPRRQPARVRGAAGIVTFAAIVVRPEFNSVSRRSSWPAKTVGVPFYFGTHYPRAASARRLHGRATQISAVPPPSNGSRERFNAHDERRDRSNDLDRALCLARREKRAAGSSARRSITALKSRRTRVDAETYGAFNRAVCEAGEAHQRRQGELPALLHRLSRGRRTRRSRR